MTELGPIQLGLVLLAPWLLGWALLRVVGLRWRDDGIAYAAWAWMAGALATGVLAFLSLALSLPHRILPATVLLAALAIGVAGRLRGPAPMRPAPQPTASTLRLGAMVVVAIVAVHLLAGGVIPVTTTDEGDAWSMRAKMMLVSGGFGEEWRAMTRPERTTVDVAHDYPELNPLLQYWVYANADGITHFENRLPIQAFALSLVLILASLLGRLLRPLAALVALVSVVTTTNFWVLGVLAYSDVMIAAGALLALQGWLRLRGTGSEVDGRFAFLGCLGLAVSVWTKNEGLLLLVAVISALVLIHGRRPRTALTILRARPRAWTWLALPIAFGLLARGFNAWFDYRNVLLSPPGEETSAFARALLGFPDRIGTYVSWFAREIVARPHADHGVFWAFLVALLVLPRRFVGGVRALPIVVVLLFLAGVTAVFFAGTQDFTWYLDTSGRRVYTQMLPVMLVLVAHLVALVWPRVGPRPPRPDVKAARLFEASSSPPDPVRAVAPD